MLPLLLALVQDTYAPDPEGFIRNWLVLAPIPCEAESNGAVEIDTRQLPDEGRIAPKAGDKALGLVWTAHRSPDFFVDFRAAFGRERGEHAIAYAVAYVRSEAERDGLTLKVGSNDQCKAYLNGVQVLRADEGRTLEKDQNDARVTLRKGVNTLVLKVINEGNNWQGCARFTAREGRPVPGLRIALAP